MSTVQNFIQKKKKKPKPKPMCTYCANLKRFYLGKKKKKTKQKNNGKTKVEKDKRLAMEGRRAILSSTFFVIFSLFWRD